MTHYIQKIRSKIGHEHLIQPAARILIENNKGQFLMIKRVDDGQWGIPAGALEEEETIEQCIIREVKEETGITINHPTLIGISSHPDKETVTYHNGDVTQYFTIEFYTRQWEGEININQTDEVKYANWMHRDHLKLLPFNEASTVESLYYYQSCNQVRIS